mgnify:CR=1 FL=1
MIRITSKRNGFRRCGVAHPATPTDYTDDRFTPKELERLRAEPMLVVEELDGDPAGGGQVGGIDDLVAAIDQLPEDGWTGDHKPKADALGEVVGRQVTAAERDQAWAAYQGGSDA